MEVCARLGRCCAEEAEWGCCWGGPNMKYTLKYEGSDTGVALSFFLCKGSINNSGNTLLFPTSPPSFSVIINNPIKYPIRPTCPNYSQGWNGSTKATCVRGRSVQTSSPRNYIHIRWFCIQFSGSRAIFYFFFWQLRLRWWIHVVCTTFDHAGNQSLCFCYPQPKSFPLNLNHTHIEESKSFVKNWQQMLKNTRHSM